MRLTGTWKLCEGIKSGKMEDLIARLKKRRILAVLSQMGNIAFRSGKKLEWDKQKGRFTDESIIKKYLAAPCIKRV